MHSSAGLLLATLLIASLPSPASAWWYARQESDTRYAGCVKAEDSMDAVFAHVSQGWARASQGRGAACTIMRKGAEALVGLAVDCAEGGVHLFLRSEAQCRLFVKTMNSKEVAKPEDFVPEGVQNRRTWLDVYGACMDDWYHAETIKRGALQATAAMCECWATKVSETDAALTQELVGSAGKACLAGVPDADRPKLITPKTP